MADTAIDAEESDVWTPDLADIRTPSADLHPRDALDTGNDTRPAGDAVPDVAVDAAVDQSDATMPGPCGPEYEIGCPQDHLPCGEDFDGPCLLHGYTPCRLEPTTNDELTVAFFWVDAFPGCQGHCAESETHRIYTFDPSTQSITLDDLQPYRNLAGCNVSPFDAAQDPVELNGKKYTLHEKWASSTRVDGADITYRNPIFPSEELWVTVLKVEDAATGAFLYDVDFPLFQKGLGKVPPLQ